MPERKEQKNEVSKLIGFWATGFHQESPDWREKDLQWGVVCNGMSQDIKKARMN